MKVTKLKLRCPNCLSHLYLQETTEGIPLYKVTCKHKCYPVEYYGSGGTSVEKEYMPTHFVRSKKAAYKDAFKAFNTQTKHHIIMRILLTLGLGIPIIYALMFFLIPILKYQSSESVVPAIAALIIFVTPVVLVIIDLLKNVLLAYIIKLRIRSYYLDLTE